MRALKVAVPTILLLAGFLLCTSAGFGKPEYMKKENLKSCTTCHSKMEAKENMAKNLNDTGKCYAKNDHSLENCKK
ncbi:MAG TPA: hypothetical protein VE959_11400 [Bryobacteraceae bacterium]|nr:hypothetical protein [Bryobacteraceae bacterium]